MRKWKNVVESAREALAEEETSLPSPPEESGCEGCRHYLGGGSCAISMEQECRDGGFQAREE